MVLAFNRFRWWLIWFAGLAPLIMLVYQVVMDQVGADPAQAIVLATGIWALRFLWLTLAVSLLRQIKCLSWLIRYRRMLGLYALLYVVLHVLAFTTFILGWRFDLIIREFTERPYIVFGLSSLVLLIPLGVTSTHYWMKKLGRNWIQLHYLVYPAALLALVHFILQIRGSYSEQLLYGLMLVLLLGYRVMMALIVKKLPKKR